MQVKELWEKVLNGEAIAISPSGCSVSGENARQYDMFSDWKILVMVKGSKFFNTDTYYISNGEIVEEVHY